MFVQFCINIVISSIFVCVNAAEDPIVQLPHGKIRGHILESGNGYPYYAFQDIPFAAPPVGENRFKLPKEPKPWSGILNTTRNRVVCYQLNFTSQNLHISEDCLYLNVYSPVAPGSKERLPVLVLIHGGGFYAGTGASPKWIIDHGIVVVTINYRLGFFGFLTTNDDVIPPNLGFKDQLFALEWINRNIGLFGGNSSKVTINGGSAGAMAIGMHLMGPWPNNKTLDPSLRQAAASVDKDPAQIFGIQYNISKVNKTVAGNLIRRIYTNTTFEDNIGAYIRYISDSLIGTSTIKQADLESKFADVYLYEFSYKGQLGRHWDVPNIPGTDKVVHGEDFQYFWTPADTDITKFPVEDRLTMQRYSKLWTNFIKYHNPTPERDSDLQNITWKKVDPNRLDNIAYLNINTTLKMGTNPRYWGKVKKVMDYYITPEIII